MAAPTFAFKVPTKTPPPFDVKKGDTSESIAEAFERATPKAQEPEAEEAAPQQDPPWETKPQITIQVSGAIDANKAASIARSHVEHAIADLAKPTKKPSPVSTAVSCVSYTESALKLLRQATSDSKDPVLNVAETHMSMALSYVRTYLQEQEIK